MRRLAVILTACVLIFGMWVNVGAQDCEWRWQHPMPQGNTITDIHLFDSNSLVGVGIGGTIVKTLDDGETWDVQYYGGLNSMGMRNSFTAVYFIDNNTGWATGQWHNIIRTTDGGNTWDLQNRGSGSGSLSDIFFTDSNIGWAVGDNRIYSTTNGGDDWDSEVSDDKINTVFFSDADHGWMAGQSVSYVTGVVYSTTDGGESWNPTILGANFDNLNFKSIYFINNDTGWAVGTKGISMPPDQNTYGVVYKTTDGGESWNQTYELFNSAFNKVCFADGMNGWVAGDGGLLKTTNGGTAWTIDSNIQVADVAFVDQYTGWATSGSGIAIKSTDGGDNWEFRTEIITQSLIRDIYFIDENNGLAVGAYGGIILRTTDGGENWSTQYSNPNQMLYNINYVDEHHIWVTGFGAIILFSDDGGVSWEPQASPVPYDFRSSCFIDENHGWITTSERVILITNDGGDNWDIVNLDENGGSEVGGVWDIQFVDSLHGWIAGMIAFLITDDGGYTWHPANQGLSVSVINSMYFVNSNLGYCVTIMGRIFRTTDGGESWEMNPVPSNSILPLTSICFANESVGWACGLYGEVLTTTDGFIWQQQTTPAQNDLYKVRAFSDTVAWAVGMDGTIIKYSPTTVGIEEDDLAALIPEAYSLSANYPNPFNATTSIQYELPVGSDVTIEIYDMLGRRVTTLARGMQSAGRHTVTWNAEDYSTGMYFYKLTAGEYSETKKMTLLK